MNLKYLVSAFFLIIAGTSDAIITWKGETVGNWEVLTNWAGGLPNTNSTVILNHERQTNAYTVVIQSADTTDKLWLQSFSDVPIHVRVETGGLLLLNTLRMGDKAEDRTSSFTIDGGTVIGQAETTVITNTAFLIGNNPGGSATLTITNSGSLSLLGETGLTVACRADSTGSVHVADATLQVKESMILGKGAGSFGELILSGQSLISITGSLHIAKLDNGAISPTGVVQVLDGLLECDTLNVGAEGNGQLTLNGGNVRVFAGGITIGLLNSTGQLTINGGSLTTTGSHLNIGHLDSFGTFVMNEGTALIDGIITLGSSSRSFGQIDLSGGILTAEGLIIGGAVSSTGECHLISGELRILDSDPSSLQISNGTLHIEQALLQWNNPNVTETITNAVENGTLTWDNGLAAGTYSTNGYDGRVITGQAVLYWDNLDNGSQFGQSAIWVENPTFEDWIGVFSLNPSNTLWSADPDDDGLDNLSEFALGGNPTHASPTRTPEFTLNGNTLDYIYQQRSDPAAFQLNYTLELTTNLMTKTWTTNGVEATGSGPEFEGFIPITNQISTGRNPQLFIRLLIKQL